MLGRAGAGPEDAADEGAEDVSRGRERNMDFTWVSRLQFRSTEFLGLWDIGMLACLKRLSPGYTTTPLTHPRTPDHATLLALF